MTCSIFYMHNANQAIMLKVDSNSIVDLSPLDQCTANIAQLLLEALGGALEASMLELMLGVLVGASACSACSSNSYGASLVPCKV